MRECNEDDAGIIGTDAKYWSCRCRSPGIGSLATNLCGLDLLLEFLVRSGPRIGQHSAVATKRQGLPVSAGDVALQLASPNVDRVGISYRPQALLPPHPANVLRCSLERYPRPA